MQRHGFYYYSGPKIPSWHFRPSPRPVHARPWLTRLGAALSAPCPGVNPAYFRARLISCLLGCLFAVPTHAIPSLPDADTPLQRRQYQSLPSAAEIDDYLRQLAQYSSVAKVFEFGRTVGDRPMLAVRASTDKEFIETGRSSAGKLTAILVGSQHPPEASGACALLVYAHEVLQGRLASHLKYLNLIIVPDSNPDGWEKRIRTNANGVNLSTDYLLLSQPESQSLAKLVRESSPHALLDLHESALWKKSSLGAEGYLTNFETQIEVANQANVNRQLKAFSTAEFLPGLIAAISRKGLPASHYVGEITSAHQAITHGGFTLGNLRNYAAYQGVFATLIENRLDPPGRHPSYRNIEQRTAKQYLSLTTYLQQLIKRRAKISVLTNAAKRAWQYGPRQTVYLQSAYLPDTKNPTVLLPLYNQKTQRLQPVRFVNRTRLTYSLPIKLPRFYAVTAEHAFIASLLDRHGIRYQVLKAPKYGRAVIQTVKKLVIAPGPHIKRRIVGVDLKARLIEAEAPIRLAPRDLLIDMQQPLARLIPDVFDPRSSSSLFRRSQYTMLLMKYQDFFVVPVREVFE